MRPLALALALVLPLALAGCLSGGPLTGEPAPSFSFITNEGRVVNETTYLGQFVILDLMATWCGPCKLEVQHLRVIQETYGDRVVIISVGADPSETMHDLERFGQEHGANWPYAIDRDGAVKKAMVMRIIPKLIILDPEGVVVFERQGEVGPAAISRVIDPSVGGGSFPWMGTLGALGLGALAAFNPYRRTHRDAPGAGPTLAALAGLAVLAIVAWPFSGLASTRATYGSLFVGALTLASILWWPRARRKAREPAEGRPWQRAGDRAYELAPGFAAALVIALTSVGSTAFFAPLFAFVAGAGAAYAARASVPERARDAIGLAGLGLTGIGLVLFGARIFGAYAA